MRLMLRLLLGFGVASGLAAMLGYLAAAQPWCGPVSGPVIAYVLLTQEGWLTQHERVLANGGADISHRQESVSPHHVPA